MNGRTEETSLLIDKQVGILSFDTIARGNNNFLGIVDLGIEAEPQPFNTLGK
jgi:lipopolysaccharide transport system ATP-binding protein